jgi:hypothetical protein
MKAKNIIAMSTLVVLNTLPANAQISSTTMSQLNINDFGYECELTMRVNPIHSGPATISTTFTIPSIVDYYYAGETYPLSFVFINSDVSYEDVVSNTEGHYDRLQNWSNYVCNLLGDGSWQSPIVPKPFGSCSAFIVNYENEHGTIYTYDPFGGGGGVPLPNYQPPQYIPCQR